MVLMSFFSEPTFEDFKLKEDEIQESLDDIYQQLCEVKGIKSEVMSL